jgi:hypothetical protein
VAIGDEADVAETSFKAYRFKQQQQPPPPQTQRLSGETPKTTTGKPREINGGNGQCAMIESQDELCWEGKAT